MENNQLLPFERNRYYVGKLLTSADFAAEQTYFNNKRRFMNELVLGAGVVCGLGVYSLDDLSVMVESGVAVDGMGREIVLENSVVKKLSAIEGFETLETDRALLCLRYHETPVHPVYAISRQDSGEDYELNRIREGYELFLIDKPMGEELPEPESEFLRRERMYFDMDYAIDLAFPAAVSCGSSVKLEVILEKLSDSDASLSLECILQTPAFSTAAGEHEVNVTLSDLQLREGEKVRREYWLTAQDQEVDDSLIIVKSEFVKLTIGEAEQTLDDNCVIKTAVVGLPTDELIARETGRLSLELREAFPGEEFIRLAELGLQRTKNAYIIDSVSEDGVKKYIRTAASDGQRAEFRTWFTPAERPAAGQKPAGAERQGEAGRSYSEPLYASGVCEIPLDANIRKGDIVLSDEIMHGLGKGNVYVSVGFEYLSDDARLGTSAKSTIYGNADLFAHEKLPISYAETAVKVMNDRGSFIAAARLTRDTNYVLMLMRWVAIKLPADDDHGALQKLAGKSIDAVQPTVVLATRESHYFSVRFKNMEPCALLYELTEKDSGEITPDGIYTAPAREGVYEIRISCADFPQISTYAYAIVKRKELDAEQPEEGK